MLTELFLTELMEKHGVKDAVDLVDSAPWFKVYFIDTDSDSTRKPERYRTSISNGNTKYLPEHKLF